MVEITSGHEIFGTLKANTTLRTPVIRDELTGGLTALKV